MFQRFLAVSRSRPHRRCLSSRKDKQLLHTATTTTRHRRRTTRRVVTHHHLPSSSSISHSASVSVSSPSLALSSPSPHFHHHHHHHNHHTYHPQQPTTTISSSLHTPAHPLSAMSTDPASTPNQAKQKGGASTDGTPAVASTAATPNQQSGGKDLKDRYIGSIDQGTTSSRFIIFNGHGHQVATHQEEFTQLHPHSG